MRGACPICEERTRSVDAHVRYEHATGRYCWCGENIQPYASSAGLGVEIFRKHCEARGGYLAHYLECQLGVAVDGKLSDMR
jgi:hypothetical protein